MLLASALSALLLFTACDFNLRRPSRAEASPKRAEATRAIKAPRYDAERYEAALQAIEAQRQRLARRYAEAKGERQKRAIRAEARGVVTRAITETIFPAWMGTPWGLGRNSTATRPHQEGMVVGCSYFVTSVLQNAGLKLSNRYTFAQAPALHIQRSLAPARADLHRFLSIPPSQLEAKLRKLSDGLYVIGLVNHVGFVVIRGDEVRIVHSSFTGERDVADEALAEAPAVAASQEAGYFVTPLFQDDRLIAFWLEGRAVPFQKLGM
ncbi:MAG: hypothetical protein CMH57_00910 [Myxococcales bacterium]|nr:hypothetical protein [Myxococcales bacterium]